MILPSRFAYFCFQASIYINDVFILKINKFSFENDCESYIAASIYAKFLKSHLHHFALFNAFAILLERMFRRDYPVLFHSETLLRNSDDIQS